MLDNPNQDGFLPDQDQPKPDTELLAEVAALIIRDQKCSSSYVQRKFNIGYNKAARMVEELEEMGVVTSADHVGKREVVATEVPPALLMQAETVKKSRVPTKQTAADREATSGSYGVAAGELKQFIERIERLEEEKKEVGEQIKEVMAEAKGRGYDTKVMRKVIALRKRDADDIAEEEAVLEMYKAALGMA